MVGGIAAIHSEIYLTETAEVYFGSGGHEGRVHCAKAGKRPTLVWLSLAKHSLPCYGVSSSSLNPQADKEMLIRMRDPLLTKHDIASEGHCPTRSLSAL